MNTEWMNVKWYYWVVFLIFVATFFLYVVPNHFRAIRFILKSKASRLTKGLNLFGVVLISFMPLAWGDTYSRVKDDFTKMGLGEKSEDKSEE